MSQFVFVLTGKGGSRLNRYAAGLKLAALSVRHFHPDVPIVCLGDEFAERLCDEPSAHLGKAVDRFVACPDASGGAVHRSRVIKTTLRRRLDGPFVYLDTDTVLLSDLRPLLACAAPVGFVADAWFPDAVGEFPNWCIPLYRAARWNYPTRRYMNSGVFYAGDSSDVAALFDDWHRRFVQSVEYGVTLDQPALNSALHELATSVQEFPEEYNFFCGRSPRLIPPATRLLHVCCSLPATVVPAYESAITALQQGKQVDVAALIETLQASGFQRQRRFHHFRDLGRRIGQFTRRRLWASAIANTRRHR